MSQLYSRVFLKILDSSIAGDFHTRHIFEDFLKLADDGVVDMTREAISRRLNVPLKVLNEAISKLEAPDPSSRNPNHEGRRLAKLDDHRDWGWLILNWDEYEAIKCKEDQRAKTLARVRRHRAKQTPPSPALLPQDKDSSPSPEGALQKRYQPLQSVTLSSSQVWSLKQQLESVELRMKEIKEKQGFVGANGFQWTGPIPDEFRQLKDHRKSLKDQMNGIAR